ncbi:MAG: hypothetical protein WAV41_01830 [Microgenomates group bacterium]
MDYSRNINDNIGVYLKYDYLMFPINLNIVPKIAVGGDMFYSKSNYHVSLLCLENVPKKDQIKILNFAQKCSLKLGKTTNTFKLAAENDQKTIVVRVGFSGLKWLISGINKRLSYHFRYPPTHITLFTLKGQTGIGIDTFIKYRQICSQISPSDVKRLIKSFKLV